MCVLLSRSYGILFFENYLLLVGEACRHLPHYQVTKLCPPFIVILAFRLEGYVSFNFIFVCVIRFQPIYALGGEPDLFFCIFKVWGRGGYPIPYSLQTNRCSFQYDPYATHLRYVYVYIQCNPATHRQPLSKSDLYFHKGGNNGCHTFLQLSIYDPGFRTTQLYPPPPLLSPGGGGSYFFAPYLFRRGRKFMKK